MAERVNKLDTPRMASVSPGAAVSSTNTSVNTNDYEKIINKGVTRITSGYTSDSLQLLPQAGNDAGPSDRPPLRNAAAHFEFLPLFT